MFFLKVFVLCSLAKALEAFDYCQASYPSPESYRPLPNAKLVHLQLITRHGDRVAENPFRDDDAIWDCNRLSERVTAKVDNQNIAGVRLVVAVPKDAHTPFWKGGCVLKQLTPKGALQHLKLGSTLRNIYVNKMKFLPQTLVEGVLYARSTDTWRTKQSAASLLTGLYPESSRAPDQTYIPLEIHPDEVETMAEHPDECPKLERMEKELYQDPKYLKHYHLASKKISKFQKILQAEGEYFRIPDTIGLQDLVVTRFCHGFKLPCRDNKCITKDEVLEMSNHVNEGYEILRFGLPGSDMVNRLAFGLFLGELIAHLSRKVNGDGLVKMEYFSAHDDTIHGILGNLLVTNAAFPSYASNFLVELWREDDHYFVRIFYNGEIIRTKWCNFEQGCPFDVFFQATAKQVPKWEECLDK